MIHCDSLLQNATDVITKCPHYFITKCGRTLLQNFITKCDSYYKLRQYNRICSFTRNLRINQSPLKCVRCNDK